MPEIYINGQSSSHNSCLEIDEFGTSYVTSTGLLVTAESFNSTIAFSSPTNTLDSESSFCGIVQLIVVFFLCFALVIMIGIAICLAKRRQKPTTQGKH